MRVCVWIMTFLFLPLPNAMVLRINSVMIVNGKTSFFLSGYSGFSVRTVGMSACTVCTVCTVAFCLLFSCDQKHLLS